MNEGEIAVGPNAAQHFANSVSIETIRSHTIKRQTGEKVKHAQIAGSRCDDYTEVFDTYSSLIRQKPLSPAKGVRATPGRLPL